MSSDVTLRKRGGFQPLTIPSSGSELVSFSGVFMTGVHGLFMSGVHEAWDGFHSRGSGLSLSQFIIVIIQSSLSRSVRPWDSSGRY